MKTQCNTVFKIVFSTTFLFNISYQTRKLALPNQFLRKLAEYLNRVNEFFTHYGYFLFYLIVERKIYTNTQRRIINASGISSLSDRFYNSIKEQKNFIFQLTDFITYNERGKI